jgi:polyhydroxyalkanoate synthesis regulator phasin
VNSPESDQATDPWGRVSEDGSVYVRTAEGERKVGQWPDGDPAEALAFFKKRYDDLAFEVELLEQRVKSGTLAPDEATAAVKQVHASIHDAQAVGDLAGLDARLDALTGTINERREQRKAERARKVEEARHQKETIASEAERLSGGADWRNGANRMRELLEQWKSLPRLDRGADDALWRRFSTARTTYTRRRKAHFAELNEKRDSARVVKERLVVEAEALADSTEWGPTSGMYRDLMRQWKAAGPAPKGVDDQLWKRFRAAQDKFFGARDAANAELDRQFAENAEKKEALLVEAEALLPVTDLKAAKESFRDIAERWDAAGKVPRERMKELEGRIRRVEQAIRGVEDDEWRRSNPEARARAADTVSQLEASIAELQAKHDRAVAAGNTQKAEEHATAMEARKAWLAEARKALDEFSG